MVILTAAPCLLLMIVANWTYFGDTGQAVEKCLANAWRLTQEEEWSPRRIQIDGVSETCLYALSDCAPPMRHCDWMWLTTLRVFGVLRRLARIRNPFLKIQNWSENVTEKIYRYYILFCRQWFACFSSNSESGLLRGNLPCWSGVQGLIYLHLTSTSYCVL